MIPISALLLLTFIIRVTELYHDTRNENHSTHNSLHALWCLKSALAQGATLYKLSKMRPPSSVDREMVRS